jgi:hypothetical protein
MAGRLDPEDYHGRLRRLETRYARILARLARNQARGRIGPPPGAMRLLRALDVALKTLRRNIPSA